MWYQFPYGVLGVALSTALFTEMSDCISRKDNEGFKKHLNLGLRTTWLLIVPMAVLLFVCSDELIGLYTAGKFTASDIRPVADLLCGWAVALPLFAGYMFLYRAYSSIKDLKTIAICNLFLTVIQITVYMVLTGVISIPGMPTIGLVGIACGDITFYLLMIVVLLLIMRKRVGNFHFSKLAISTAKVIVASIVGGIVAELVSWLVESFVDITNIFGSLVTLVIVGAVGLAVIIIACRILHVDEISSILSRLTSKLRRQ